MRVPQARASKGSQKWIQLLVNERRDVFASALECHLPTELAEGITWLSPLREDAYAEYRDADFLARLGVECPNLALREFWPSNGPQWDALARASETGPFLLIEAKANLPELTSSCGADSEASLELIRRSLQSTQDYLGCSPLIDWTSDYYQHANRLAHLYFLRELNRQDARLVFVYFVNDDTHISTSLDEWRGALAIQKKRMGLGKHRLQDAVVELFVDTQKLG